VGEAKLQRFADGEVYFQLLENVRGVDVFVVQPTCYPVDQHLVELIGDDRRAQAGLGGQDHGGGALLRVRPPGSQGPPARSHQRQAHRRPADDRRRQSRLFVDLHAAQIQGFFNIPVDHLFASPVLVSYFRELNLPNLTVVSPDAGGVERARFFAQKVGAPLAIVDKRRTDMNVAEVMNVVGDVKGKTCLIIDDIVDTAGTLVKTVDALYASMARRPCMPAPATPCFRARLSTALPILAWSNWW
jgi:ribose-phosphate pyrophosphokinase